VSPEEIAQLASAIVQAIAADNILFARLVDEVAHKVNRSPAMRQIVLELLVIKEDQLKKGIARSWIEIACIQGASWSLKGTQLVHKADMLSPEMRGLAKMYWPEIEKQLRKRLEAESNGAPARVTQPQGKQT
jgi:hypothetical protein